MRLSHQTHRMIFGAVILMLLVWPAVHRVAAHRLDINPWKLCGFAMYCTPHLIAVDVIDRRADGDFEIRRTQMGDPARDALRSFERRRRHLGRLADPKQLARIVLRDRPEMQTIWIAIGTTRLDGKTSRLRETWRDYEYERGDLLGNDR